METLYEDRLAKKGKWIDRRQGREGLHTIVIEARLLRPRKTVYFSVKGGRCSQTFSPREGQEEEEDSSS